MFFLLLGKLYSTCKRYPPRSGYSECSFLLSDGWGHVSVEAFHVMHISMERAALISEPAGPLMENLAETCIHRGTNSCNGRSRRRSIQTPSTNLYCRHLSIFFFQNKRKCYEPEFTTPDSVKETNCTNFHYFIKVELYMNLLDCWHCRQLSRKDLQIERMSHDFSNMVADGCLEMFASYWNGSVLFEESYPAPPPSFSSLYCGHFPKLTCLFCPENALYWLFYFLYGSSLSYITCREGNRGLCRYRVRGGSTSPTFRPMAILQISIFTKKMVEKSTLTLMTEFFWSLKFEV